MKILVTGAAGFIGFHTVIRLLEGGYDVVGIDNFNAYYDPELKHARVAELERIAGEVKARGGNGSFRFERVDLAETKAVNDLMRAHEIEYVVNLAAQAGVRYSLEAPLDYVNANITGFTNLLEASAKLANVRHFVYASTSSVYGANLDMPFSEHKPADHPIQFYAATKRANELMAHAYSHIYRMPTTGLRFFTVYGPWGRPDMALFTFTKNILEGRPIKLFNYGNHSRDFTYVKDIGEGVVRVMETPAEPDPDWDANAPDPAGSSAPWRVFNIGNAKPVPLLEYVEAIEDELGMKAERELLPMQLGDVPDTYADVSDLERMVGYRPNTPVREGVRRFVEWYRDYYGV